MTLERKMATILQISTIILEQTKSYDYNTPH